MNNETAEADVGSLIASVETLANRFVSGLYARFAALSGVPVDFENLRASLSAGGTSLLVLLFEIVLVVALVAGVSILLTRRFKKASAAGSSWRRFFAGMAAAFLALRWPLVGEA